MPRRNPALHVERAGGEVIAYDRTSGTAHVLTAEASAVWDLCDGSVSREQADAELGREVVDSALVQLEAAGMLDASGTDRRTLVKRGALVGGAVMVSTLIAPRVAAAASTTGGGGGGVTDPNTAGVFFVPAGSTLTITDFDAAKGAGNPLRFGYRINQSARTELGSTPGGGGDYPQSDFVLPASASDRLFEVYLFDNTGKPSGADDELYYFYTSNPNHSEVAGSNPYDFAIRDNGGVNADANTPIFVGPGNLSGTITISNL